MRAAALLLVLAAAAASPVPPAQLALGVPGPSTVSYAGDQVWRVQLDALGRAERDRLMAAIESLDLDVWSATRSALDVRVPAHLQPLLASRLPTDSHAAFIPDLDALITSSAPALSAPVEAWNLSTLDTPFHDAFHRLDEIERFGEALVAQFGEAVERVEVGKSSEGRSIWALRARLRDGDGGAGGGGDGGGEDGGDNGGGDGEDNGEGDRDDGGDDNGDEASPAALAKRKKAGKGHHGKAGRGKKAGRKGKGKGKGEHSHGHGKGPLTFPDPQDEAQLETELEILVQSGSHAREWVGPAASLYFLHSLLLDATADDGSAAARLLRQFTVTVVPTINPDGYVYSHERARMWRKNRQPTGPPGAPASCTGIDLNSNWGYRWQASRKSPCSDAWAGSRAFEALETQAVADYMNGTAGERKVKAFVDLHSYGQLFMFPFAHSCDEFPDDAEMLMEAGLGVVKAMRHQHDEEYEAGQACDLTLRAPGDAIDYAYGARDIRWSYSAELRDTGTYGFMLPPSQIRATGDEIGAGLRFLAAFIYKVELAG